MRKWGGYMNILKSNIKKALEFNPFDMDRVLSLFYVTNVNELLYKINDIFDDEFDELINNEEFNIDYRTFLFQLVDHIKNNDDLLTLKFVVNRNIRTIKESLKKYTKYKEKKDGFFHQGKRFLSSLNGISEYIENMIESNLIKEDFHVLWFIITTLKNTDYVFYIFQKNPELVNTTNKEGAYLFSNLVDYYIVNIHTMTPEDIKYFKRVIVLMLETDELFLSNDALFSILEKLENNLKFASMDNKQNLFFIINEINAHYSVINAQARTNSVSYTNTPCPIDVTTREDDDRVDLTDQFVISIDRVNKEKMTNTLIDDAYALEMQDDGSAILYVHVPDVDYYVKKDSSTDKYMRAIGESVYAKEYKTPMLNLNIASLCSLNSGQKRPCITFKMKVMPNGQITDVEFMKSIINVNYNLTSRSAQTFMGHNSDPRLNILNDMYKVAKNMRKYRKEKVGKRSKPNVIIDEFNIGPDIATAAYCKEHGILFPYKNFYGKKSPFNHDDVQAVNDFIEDNDLSFENVQLLQSIFDSFHRVFYDIEDHGNKSFNGMSSGNVGNPLREYISLETLRLIKDLIIAKEGNDAYWESRIMRDCIEYTETTARIKTLYGK